MASGEVENDNPVILPNPRSGHADPANFLLAHLEAHHGTIQELVDRGLTVVKIGDLLGRRGIVVPEAGTLHRYCAERCGSATKKDTVPLADPEPGRELQADSAAWAWSLTPSGRALVGCARLLILVAVWSRDMFVWLTFSQTTADVIEGTELGWAYFGGIFPVLIPDNLSPVITKAEPTEPRINDIFLEYSQERGFRNRRRKRAPPPGQGPL